MSRTDASRIAQCESTLVVPTQTDPVRCGIAEDHIMHIGRDHPMPTHTGKVVRVERRWIDGLPGSSPRVRLTGLNERNQ